MTKLSDCPKHGQRHQINLGDGDVACSECYMDALRGFRASTERWHKKTGVWLGGSTVRPDWLDVFREVP